MIIGNEYSKKNRTNTWWRYGNAGAPPRGNQVPTLEEVSNDDQAMVNPPPLADGDIRAAFLQMSQAITTQL